MKISRATFLKTCSIAVIGAFVDGAAKLWTVSEAEETSGSFRLHDATATLFRKYLNDSFAVWPADAERRSRLVLAKVSERPLTKNVEQFSLIFHASGQPLPDGTHRFQHRALGTFELFIVAVGVPNDRRTVYQACFSRHLSART